MPNILENITGGLTDFTSKIANVFDNGLSIYTSVDDRLRAIKQINKETIVNNPPVVISQSVAAEQDLNKQNQKGIQTASLALIAAGILFVILIVLVVKRKRG